MTLHRSALIVALALALCACARSSALEPVPTYAPAADTMASVQCQTALTGTWVDDRPLVTARCHTLAMTMASHHTQVIYLRDLLRMGRDAMAVGDHEIQETAEYKSYMDSRNRWQWQLYVTHGEALGACRAMLVDLAAGVHVEWETQAREYLMRVRFASAPSGPTPSPAPPAHTRGSSRVTPSQPGNAPARTHGPGNAPPATKSPDDPPATRGPGPVTTGPGSPRMPMRIDYYYRFDDDWHLLESLRASGRHTVADRLEHLLEDAGTQLAAVTILLSGTSILITGLTTPAGVLELSILADGTVPANMALATRTSGPAIQQLAETVNEIERLKSSLAPFEPLVQPGIDTLMEPRIEYRKLLYDALESLDQADLERLRELASLTGGAATKLAAGTPIHKAQRWHDYLDRGGTWQFERWSTTYDQNMTRASEAHARADAYRDKLGWGQREYTVSFEDMRRVLDIADPIQTRGVEVKTGYVSLTADVAYELKRDMLLVSKYDWTIEWFVDGRMSEPLRKTLRAANIQFTETKPTSPIKDL